MLASRLIWQAVPLTLGVGLLALMLILPSPIFVRSSSHGESAPSYLVDSSSETLGDYGMVLVPAGNFIMGGDPLSGVEPGRVVFVAAFMIDRTEVTVAAYAAFAHDTGYRSVAEQHEDARSWRSNAQHDIGAQPVVYIAWEDAVAYCEYVGKRLPTEIEWEKAARGRDARLWPWGNEWDETRANTMERGDAGTTPVGSFPSGASPYGLVDMAGNAWEWTAGAYGVTSDYDAFSQDEDNRVFRNHRVLRGGSWRTMALGAQATYRKPAPPDYRRDSTGFRCAGNTASK